MDKEKEGVAETTIIGILRGLALGIGLWILIAITIESFVR